MIIIIDVYIIIINYFCALAKPPQQFRRIDQYEITGRTIVETIIKINIIIIIIK